MAALRTAWAWLKAAPLALLGIAAAAFVLQRHRSHAAKAKAAERQFAAAVEGVQSQAELAAVLKQTEQLQQDAVQHAQAARAARIKADGIAAEIESAGLTSTASIVKRWNRHD